MFLCCQCGKKLTNKQTYFTDKLLFIYKDKLCKGKRPVCKECKQEIK